MVSARLGNFLDVQFGKPTLGTYIGGGKKTQPLEIAHALQLVIDKGPDCCSQACISQMDIANDFDSLPTVEIRDFLLDEGCDPLLIAVAIRHQMFSNV